MPMDATRRLLSIEPHSVRSFAKGCFIELDTLHEEGLVWETKHRWNYAVQENVGLHAFTFPECDIFHLMDISHQLVHEHMILDAQVYDFADLAEQVGELVVLSGLDPGASRASIVELLASKNRVLTSHVEDLIRDPILMPESTEHAMSINIFCSADVSEKQLIFVRLVHPVMCFMDTPIAAQYAVFCFGPPGEEAACIAEGCAFAAVMSDYNLEKAIRTASNEQTVRQAFLEHITDLVVLPHVHIHSSLRTHLRGSEKNSNVGTPSGRGSPIKGRNEASVTEVTPTRMSGVVRNRADATDVLEDLLELCITDFEHADDAARGVGRHDIHEETHMHKHEDGETITFDDNDHTESFVIMRAIDTDGPFAGCQRTLHRWHNALQQDCVMNESSAQPAVPDMYGGVTMAEPSRRRSGSHFNFRRSSSAPDNGAQNDWKNHFSPPQKGKAARSFADPHHTMPMSLPVLQWGTPHLPHESAPLMAEALDELTDKGCIFLDVPAASMSEMYEITAEKLRERLEVLGLVRDVGELGVNKLLSCFEMEGNITRSLSVSSLEEFQAKTMENQGTSRANDAPFATDKRPLGPPPPGDAIIPTTRSGLFGRTMSDLDLAQPRVSSEAEGKRPSRPRGISNAKRRNSLDNLPKSLSQLHLKTGKRQLDSETALFMESDRMTGGNKAALFGNSDDGSSREGTTWHEESMEVLCVHSAVLPPGRKVTILVRLECPVENVRNNILSESDSGPVETYPAVKWFYVCLGAYHPLEIERNEGIARAMSLFFASDDVYDCVERSKSSEGVVAAIRSFLRHACIVPRARNMTMARRASLIVKQAAREKMHQAQELWESVKQLNRNSAVRQQNTLRKRLRRHLKLQQQIQTSSGWTRLRAMLQKYSLPLLGGVAAALVLCNLVPEHYEYYIGSDHHGDHFSLTGHHWKLLGHPITVHFLTNDIFMVFFFGLAAKEITEALLPGGALSPYHKALSPLLGTIGGVVGPVFVYLILSYIFWEAGAFNEFTCDDDGEVINHDDDNDSLHRFLMARHARWWRSIGKRKRRSDDSATSYELERRQLSSTGDDDHGDDLGCEEITLEMVLSGWGVPTATDISLAWMVSVIVFGLGHHAIGFLLLLAVVDDGIGLVIIAAAYPDPEKPVQPQWMPLIPVGMLVAYALRRLKVEAWQWYVLVAGPVSWFGFLLSGIHPALALVPIVPFMPHVHLNKEHINVKDKSGKMRRRKGKRRRNPGAVQGGSASFSSPKYSVASNVRSANSFNDDVMTPLGTPHNSVASTSEDDDDPWMQALNHRMATALGVLDMDVDDSVTVTTTRSEWTENTGGSTTVTSLGTVVRGTSLDRCDPIDLPKRTNQPSNAALQLANIGFKGPDGAFTRVGGHVTFSIGPDIDLAGLDAVSAGGASRDEGSAVRESIPSHVVGTAIETLIDAEGGMIDDMDNMEDLENPQPRAKENREERPALLLPQNSSVGTASGVHAHPALHQFEHDTKLFVDLGMFFFAICNAGVKISVPGGMTISILLALIVGKTAGIAGFTIAGDMFFGIALPSGISYGDIFMLAFIASMGLTVALFVAGEAFTATELEEQAKMGALLSGLVGPAAVLIDRYFRKGRGILGNIDKESKEKQEFSFNSHVMRCTEEIDEKVVREGLVRLLKKRHEEFEKMKDAAERETQKVTEQRIPKSRKRTRKPRRGSI